MVVGHSRLASLISPAAAHLPREFERARTMAPKQRMRIANEKATKNITLRGNVPKSSVSLLAVESSAARSPGRASGSGLAAIRSGHQIVQIISRCGGNSERKTFTGIRRAWTTLREITYGRDSGVEIGRWEESTCWRDREITTIRLDRSHLTVC